MYNIRQCLFSGSSIILAPFFQRVHPLPTDPQLAPVRFRVAIWRGAVSELCLRPCCRFASPRVSAPLPSSGHATGLTSLGGASRRWATRLERSRPGRRQGSETGESQKRYHLTRRQKTTRKSCIQNDTVLKGHVEINLDHILSRDAILWSDF